jgi:hypothetical protein
MSPRSSPRTHPPCCRPSRTPSREQADGGHGREEEGQRLETPEMERRKRKEMEGQMKGEEVGGLGTIRRRRIRGEEEVGKRRIWTTTNTPPFRR